MSNKIQLNISDRVGQFYTSIGAVILILTVVIAGMTTISHTLFSEVFPPHMTDLEKRLATWGMAMAWESTLLLMTCNYKPIDPKISIKLGFASTIMALFFIGGFDFHEVVVDDWTTWLFLLKKWFMGTLFGWMSYSYSELFYVKWKERNDKQVLPMKLTQSESKVNELESTIIQLQSAVDERQSKLVQSERELDDLRRFKAKIEHDLTCPHCKQIQPGYGTLHAHKGHCSHNPRNGVSKADLHNGNAKL